MVKRSSRETDAQKVIRHLTRTPYEEMMRAVDDHIWDHASSNDWPIDDAELLLYVYETHGWTEDEIRQYLANK